MSRGLGSVQRDILAQLQALPPGFGVCVGDGGWAYRRAAHSLAKRDLVRLEARRIDGRRHLVAKLRVSGGR